MDMQWRVGVLRPLAENIVWVSAGRERDWPAARAAAVAAAVIELAAREGRQEYRFEIDDVVGMTTPGLHEDGTVDLGELCSSVPHER